MIELQIKNMVCQRCIHVVEKILSNQNIDFNKVELGKIQLQSALSDERRKLLMEKLLAEGLELLNSKEMKIVNGIKSFLLSYLAKPELAYNNNISELLSKHMAKEYSYLSKLFSQVEGRTIENYLIQLRLEHVKELLSYNEKSISEIAYELGFSSSAHLSNQFKKHTGLTPSMFRNSINMKRIELDKL
ncbi:MAG: helix-turn-helix transcriptional regulator [Saprospiraceae bacterium]|nr:helix-turn-helix transcriptional regulator [Saprospiraceae bacterium]